MVACVITPYLGIFWQIGDGGMVYSNTNSPSKYEIVFWPMRGTYANTTFFVSDESAIDHLQYGKLDQSIDEVAIFSDGLESIALCYEDKSAHEPFFDGLLKPLRCEPPIRSEKLSRALEDFLKSQRVLERTDDDKTLIIASRCLSIEKLEAETELKS